MTWYSVMPHFTGGTWAELIQRSLDSKEPQQVKTSDQGIVTWTASPPGQAVCQAVFDMNRGANAVLLELRSPDGGTNFQCTYSWVDDGIGGFRLEEYSGIEYQNSVDQPKRKFEIKIHNFNPRPKFAANRFTRESIHLPQGTRIETFDEKPGSRPKASSIGKIVKPRISDEDLEALSEKLKEEGTSKPARSKPKK